MGEQTTFDQLCALFVKSLLDKSHAHAGDGLNKFQKSRLGESMTADIRKLGDMVFPAARRPLISMEAEEAARALGRDLRVETWHSQKAIDGYKVFTYEHLYPVRQIRTALGTARDVDEAMAILRQMLWVAWITKEEDKRLRDLGYTSNRPDPYFAYEHAGIELVVDNDERHPHDEAVAARMRLVLNMVGVLHGRGYERLRIVPGMSGSGIHWRCSFASDSNIKPAPDMQNIDQVDDPDGLVATWSNANPRVFADPNASAMTSEQLADSFVVRFPALASASRGTDPDYADWYVDLLSVVNRGFFPIFYGDYLSIADGQIPLVGQGHAAAPSLALPPPPSRSRPAQRDTSRFVWEPGDVTVTRPPRDSDSD